QWLTSVCPFDSVTEYVLFNSLRPAFLVVRGGRDFGGEGHFVNGLPHRDAQAGLAEHLNVIRAVADHGDLALLDAEGLCEARDDRAFVHAESRHVQKARL